MRIVNTTYINVKKYNRPEDWLKMLRFFTGILDELSKDHEVHSIEQINYEGKVTQGNVHYHFINFKKPRLYFPYRLHKYIKTLKPGIVFVNGLIFPWQVIQLRWKLRRSVKIVCIHHAERPFTGFKKYLQRFADRYINGYFFTSMEFGKVWIRNGNLNKKSKIFEIMEASSIFSPKDRTISRTKLGITGEQVFLWVGRLDQNKNPLMVVRAFIQFLKQNPKTKLYMIYQTTELLQNIKILVEENKVEASIRLIGRVPNDDMDDWFSSADFIISGSYYEGSGVAACEAMSCGCIPILTDIVSFRKMTGNGKCGLLYKPGDEQSLLEALVKTATIEIENERKKVLNQFKEELSFEAIGRKIDQAISSL